MVDGRRDVAVLRLDALHFKGWLVCWIKRWAPSITMGGQLSFRTVSLVRRLRGGYGKDVRGGKGWVGVCRRHGYAKGIRVGSV